MNVTFFLTFIFQTPSLEIFLSSIIGTKYGTFELLNSVSFILWYFLIFQSYRIWYFGYSLCLSHVPYVHVWHIDVPFANFHLHRIAQHTARRETASKEVEQDSKIRSQNVYSSTTCKYAHICRYKHWKKWENYKVHKVLQSTLVKKTDGKLTDEENYVRNIRFGTNTKQYMYWYKATYVVEYWYKGTYFDIQDIPIYLVYKERRSRICRQIHDDQDWYERKDI